MSRNAISFGFSALIVIVLILVAGFGLFVSGTFDIPGSGGSNLSTNTSLSSPFEVIEENTTVPYDAGCMVLSAVGHTCPTVSTNTNSSTLRGVELIAYQGSDYYAGSFSSGPYGSGPYSNGEPAVPSRDIWFTNSTIICATPSLGNYETCPVAEPLPSMVW